MTAAQLRMSRAALNLSLGELAERVAMPEADIVALEQGSGSPDADAKLRVFFEGAGLAFKDDNGVVYNETKAGAGSVPLEQLSSANDE